jgi:hypothetical protein
MAMQCRMIMIDRGQFSTLVSRAPQQAAEHSCSTLCAECASRLEKMYALLLPLEFFITDLLRLYARHAALCWSSVFRRNMVRVLLPVVMVRTLYYRRVRETTCMCRETRGLPNTHGANSVQCRKAACESVDGGALVRGCARVRGLNSARWRRTHVPGAGHGFAK